MVLSEGDTIKNVTKSTVEYGEMCINDGHYTKEEALAVERYVKQIKKANL